MNAKMLTVSDLQQLTEDQLMNLHKTIVFLIKSKRSTQAAMNMSVLRVGQQVTWMSPRARTQMTGQVTKIKRKMVEVNTPLGKWNVEASLLKAA